MDPSLTSVRSVLKSAPLYPKSSSQIHPNPHTRNAVSGSEVMPATVRGSLKPTIHQKSNAAVRGSLKSAVHREIHAAVRGSLKSAVRGESKAATSLKPPPSVAPSSLPARMASIDHQHLSALNSKIRIFFNFESNSNLYCIFTCLESTESTQSSC